MKYAIILILIPLFCYQCKKETDTFELSKNTIKIINDCREVQLMDSTRIIRNLIGNWKVIAADCGFCGTAFYENKPKGNISLEKETGFLQYDQEGADLVELSFNWWIEASGFDETYQLRTEPEHFALRLTNFCKNYMLFDQRAGDGLMLLYEKQ